MPIVESVHNEASFPNSPPDLTESKSSKSSGSFRSSCLTDTTGPENLTHFEEIALADSSRSSVDLNHVGKGLLNPPSQRSLSGTIYSKRNSAITHQTRRTSFKGQVNVAVQEQHLGMPSGLSKRRGSATPSIASIGSMSRRDQSSSRSPSPSGHLSSDGSRSPRSIRSSSQTFLSQHRNFNRRSSMQPRKTIQELEDECHDSDEEVPEDAVIWNVPISPRPPLGASAPSSRKSSTSQVNLSTSAKRSSDPHGSSTLRQADAPLSPYRPRMPHSATLPSFPPEALVPRARTKSWSQHLSEEAREVNAALEAHAEAERESSDRRSTLNDSSSSLAQKSRPKTTVVELPPLQKGNIMIDPLPVSKEKEAVLTRTRPSWLPPKSQKEERKHIREWERMMARAAEADKRREQKQVEEKREKKYMEHNIARIWEQHVFPNWSIVIQEPRTRELWWRGITPRSRGAVWAKAIGNELALSEASYAAALGRAKALEASIADLPAEERQKHKDGAWLSAIARDVPTVLPELGIFSENAPLHDALVDVLMAYSAYRSDVGYVYGTHSLAGLFVLNLPPLEAFVALANLLNRPMPLAYLVEDNSAIRRVQDLVIATLKYKIPKLHDHLLNEETGVHLDEWLSPFLMTMGTAHLSPEACSRVWDVSVFEGDKTFVRAAVGVLSLLESKLYGGREEILSLLGWGAPKWTFAEDELMLAVREAGKVSTSPERK